MTNQIAVERIATLAEDVIRSFRFSPLSNGMPVTEREQGLAEFKYVHQAILERFESVPCHIQVTITGDTAFARQEGLRMADQLAAILNLHLANWALPRDPHHQKIQSSGAPSSYAMVVDGRKMN